MANRKIAPIAISAMQVPVPITRRPAAGWNRPVCPFTGAPSRATAGGRGHWSGCGRWSGW
jgi:hypothetical protein